MSFQPPSLTALISSYPILTTLSSLVSSVDLLNLALTNHTHHDCIMASPPIFSSLLRSTLCTGSGILDRQTSHDRMRTYKWSRLAQPNERDEPIEVHLYALKCDTADTLPCCKCGINVCEECRHRLEPGVWGGPWPIPWWHHRRPHLNVSWELDSIVCLCPRCDAKAEDEVRGKFLSELCDCDELRRWICRKCKRGERKAWLDYRKDHTIMEAHFDQTMSLPDHQHERWVSLPGRRELRPPQRLHISLTHTELTDVVYLR